VIPLEERVGWDVVQGHQMVRMRFTDAYLLLKAPERLLDVDQLEQSRPSVCLEIDLLNDRQIVLDQ